jgi:hypothetical protein
MSKEIIGVTKALPTIQKQVQVLDLHQYTSSTVLFTRLTTGPRMQMRKMPSLLTIQTGSMGE